MKLQLIQIIILLMSLADLGLTYLYLHSYHTMYPENDYTKLEGNPILKISMQKLGLEKGMLLGAVIVFGIVILLTISMSEKMLYFFAGVFSMMNIYHYLNWVVLKGGGV